MRQALHCRPAGADRLDGHAVEVGKPFQEESWDESGVTGLHFVLLTPLKVARRLQSPFEGLQIGRLLGKGSPSSLFQTASCTYRT